MILSKKNKNKNCFPGLPRDSQTKCYLLELWICFYNIMIDMKRN